MKKILLFIFAFLIAVLSASAVDLAAMQTAVKVQERIIDTIIESDSSFRVDNHADGIYLAGLGAVFTVRIGEDLISPYLIGLTSFPELQMQISMNEAEQALKEATDKLETAIEDHENIKDNREANELQKQLGYIQRLRKDIHKKLEEPHSQREEFELKRRQQELENVEKELDKELSEQAESVQAFEEAIAASKRAIKAYAPEAKKAKSKAGVAAAGGTTSSVEEIYQQKQQSAERQAQNMKRMVSKLKGYFADYGPAMNLPKDEMVLLRVEFVTFIPSADLPHEYEISATAKLLDQLKSGKLIREKFLERVVLKEFSGPKPIPGDITIMKNILNTVFEYETGQEYSFHVISKEQFWESYIPGYGAVFFRKYNPELSIFRIDVKGEKGDVSVFSGTNQKKAGESYEVESRTKSVSKLQGELSELLVNYGPTLKSLKADESIVIAVKLKESFKQEKSQTLVMKLKKADIEKYRDSKQLYDKIEVIKI